MSQMSSEPRLPVRAPRGSAPALTPREWAAVLPQERPTAAPKLQDYANILLRRKRTILVSLLAVFGASLLLSAMTPRAYEATAVLLISQPSDARQGSKTSTSGNTSDMAAMGSPNMETHVQLLQGDSLAVQTALWLQKTGGPEITPQQLRASLTARSVRDTQLIRVSARAGSAEQAQSIANAAANAYVAMNRRRARGYSESTSRYLAEQLETQRQKVSKAKRDVRNFQESTGTVAPDASASDVLARIAELESDASKTAADLAESGAQLDKARNELNRQNRSIGSGQLRDDSTIQRLRAKLADLESQRLDVQQRYTDAFPEPLARINEQIRITKKQLDQEIGHVVRGQGGGGDLGLQQSLTATVIQGEARVYALTARRGQTLTDLAKEKAKLGGIPARQLQLSELQRKLEIAENVYSDLLKQSQEVEVGRVMALGNADIAEPASRPRLPVKPNVPLNVVLGLLLGLSLGAGIALAQDQLDDTVRDQGEAARLAEAPVLGTIPVFTAGGAPSVFPGNGSPNLALEAYRALRYCLDFATARRHGRVVLVTSAGPAEGKTTTVVNLAATVALSGRRVILVDTDLRRSGLRRMLGLAEDKGVSDVLLGEAELQEVLRKPAETGPTFITAGRDVSNPTELLDSARMREFVDELRGMADLVILDSPPLLSVADTLVLAGFSDALLMVCVAGESPRYNIQLARQLLAHVGETIDGVVLNKVGHKPGYGYRGGDRYYYY